MDDPRTESGEPTPGTDPTDDGAVSLTTAFELLARAPRRQLLYWLHRRDDGAVSLDALARLLDERDVDLPEPGGARVALHHVHLPKLDDAGVIEYDPDDGEVRYLGDPLLSDLLEWGRREEVLD